ncbi:hypothetical protein M8332_06920 (plasmid) [Fructilactobacillus ixorae]|uniref:Uncharacterized protein n=1 Tax=Fructilactobacillus ixorae TaxID=1750535 RepID=A0ABY5C795_9LACO|nr:hypothetical protein [Fructilactobacillus ixorae]USS94013.1 hypothetical protein M8332_06920 [Fructilactobacillus ixorae]
MSNYNYTHLRVPDPNDTSRIWTPLIDSVNGIRSAAYGIDVREYIARGFESIGVQLNLYNATLHRSEHRTDQLQAQLDESVSGMNKDAEVKQARVSWNGEVFDTLGERIKALEIDHGDVSLDVGTVDVGQTALYVQNFNDPACEFITKEIDHDETDEIVPIGIEVINAKDIGTHVQKEDNN